MSILNHTNTEWNRLASEIKEISIEKENVEVELEDMCMAGHVNKKRLSRLNIEIKELDSRLRYMNSIHVSFVRQATDCGFILNEETNVWEV